MAREAAAYLKAPREGRGCQPLLRPWRANEEPRAKRQRPAEAPESRNTKGTDTLAKTSSLKNSESMTSPCGLWHYVQVALSLWLPGAVPSTAALEITSWHTSWSPTTRFLTAENSPPKLICASQPHCPKALGRSIVLHGMLSKNSRNLCIEILSGHYRRRLTQVLPPGASWKETFHPAP